MALFFSSSSYVVHEGGGGKKVSKYIHRPPFLSGLSQYSKTVSTQAMALQKRKRGRPTRQGADFGNPHAQQPPPSKKKAQQQAEEEDEEILSDDADGEMEDIQIRNVDEDEPSSPSNETPEERRLRLARAYLRHVGVSEEATVADDHLDEDDDEEDAENTRLRDQVLAETGRGVIRLGDGLKSSFSALSVTTAHASKSHRHILSPTCISVSREEGTTAVSGGKDSRVIIWDINTCKSISVYKPTDLQGRSAGSIRDAKSIRQGHVGTVTSVSISDDGTLIASGGKDSLIRIWDTRCKETIASLSGHKGMVNGLSLRVGCRQLFSAGQDRLVKIWDIGERSYIETLFGHGGEVNDIDTMTSERAISCGRDGTVRLYKVEEGNQLLFRRSSTMSIDCISAVNEQRFVTGGDDGSVCLWGLNKKKPTATTLCAHGKGLGVEQWISSICAFRNSDLTVTGAGDGKLRFWKLEDKPKMFPIDHFDVGPGFVNGISVSRRRNVMAIAVGDEHRLGRWSKIKGAKNCVKFISLPLEGE